MLSMLLAAVMASAQPGSAAQAATFRPSRVSASAMVVGRILEGVTIDYAAAAKPAGAIQKRPTSLLIDGQHVGATLIEFP